MVLSMARVHSAHAWSWLLRQNADCLNNHLILEYISTPHYFEARNTCVLIMALPLTDCRTKNKFLDFTVPVSEMGMVMHPSMGYSRG